MSGDAKKTQADAKVDPPQTAIPAEGGEAAVRELQEQVKKLTDIAARAQADLQNAKQRLEKDADELRKFASESVLLKLLPVIDNFQRAFQHLPDELQSHEWVKGVAAIEQSLLKQVADLGLRKIEAQGSVVDPSRHEVLLQGPGKEGTITEVIEEGYELHGRVLRPSKVKVGDGTEVPKK